MVVLGGIVAERRGGWYGCSYARTPENDRQVFPTRSGYVATEEVGIPVGVVGHGTFDKRRLACTFIHHFLFWTRSTSLYACLCSR